MTVSDKYSFSKQFYEKSVFTFDTAINKVPVYQSWKVYDPGPGADINQRYDAMPELTKKLMRENFPKGLVPEDHNVADGLARKEIEYTYTSGTTEESVVNFWSQKWWDASEAASWKLNANTARLGYPQKEAKLASSLNIGIRCEQDLPMENRILGNRLFLNEKISLMELQPYHFQRMAEELNSFQPVILEANPSYLARLAWWAMDNMQQIYSPSVIIFTYEFPSEIHLAAIRKVFTSPFASSFGTTETGFVMMQCEAGLFHQNTEFCRLDFYPLAKRHGGPERGRVLVTTFNNPWTYILRFDAGDIVRLHPSGTCTCGRHEGFIIEAIEGRVANATFKINGDLVTTMSLDHTLALIPEIKDYHMEQQGKAEYDLQLMLADHSSDTMNRIKDSLKSLYGEDGNYNIIPVENIWPGSSGKFRRTQANFSFDQKGLYE